MAERPAIDVYPVGWLASLQRIRRYLLTPPPKGRRAAWGELRWRLRLTARWARERNWRAIKNSFNGYLAEPVAFPAGLHRCGSGWTKRRALRSLARHLRRAQGGGR